MGKIKSAIRWLWSRFGDYLAAQELWKLVAIPAGGSAVLGAAAIWLFHPASPFDLVIVALLCAAIVGVVTYWIVPKSLHVRNLTVEGTLTVTKNRTVTVTAKPQDNDGGVK